MNLQKTPRRKKGEQHHMAELTDRDVELMRQLHEIEGWGSRKLAAKFDCGRSTVRHILAYRYRAG